MNDGGLPSQARDPVKPRSVVVRYGDGAFAAGLVGVVAFIGLYAFTPYFRYASVLDFVDHSRLGVAWLVVGAGMPVVIAFVVLNVWNAARYDMAGVMIDQGKLVFNGPLPLRIPVGEVVSVEAPDGGKLIVTWRPNRRRLIGATGLECPAAEAARRIRASLGLPEEGLAPGQADRT